MSRLNHVPIDRLRELYGKLSPALNLLSAYEKEWLEQPDGTFAITPSPDMYDQLNAMDRLGIRSSDSACMLLRRLGLTCSELEDLIEGHEPEPGMCRPGKFARDFFSTYGHAVPTGQDVVDLLGNTHISILPYAGQTMFTHPGRTMHADIHHYHLMQRKLLNWFRSRLNYAIIRHGS